MSSKHFTWQAGVYSSDLSWKAKLVLSVIGARMNQYGNGAHPSAATIAKDASISLTTAKEGVKEAVEAGWLTKKNRLKAVRKDGANIVQNDSNEYEISWPESVEGGSQCDGGVGRNTTGGGSQCDGGVGRNTTTNTPIEHTTFTNVQVEEKRSAPAKPARVDFLPILIADGVSEQTAADFIAHRKSLRAPLTVTALDAIKREAAAARLSLEAVLAECVMRGWRGFKAEWVLKSEQQAARQSASAPFDPVAFVNQNRTGPRPGLQGFDSDPFDSLKVVNP